MKLGWVEILAKPNNEELVLNKTHKIISLFLVGVVFLASLIVLSGYQLLSEFNFTSKHVVRSSFDGSPTNTYKVIGGKILIDPFEIEFPKDLEFVIDKNNGKVSGSYNKSYPLNIEGAATGFKGKSAFDCKIYGRLNQNNGLTVNIFGSNTLDITEKSLSINKVVNYIIARKIKVNFKAKLVGNKIVSENNPNKLSKNGTSKVVSPPKNKLKKWIPLGSKDYTGKDIYVVGFEAKKE